MHSILPNNGAYTFYRCLHLVSMKYETIFGKKKKIDEWLPCANHLRISFFFSYRTRAKLFRVCSTHIGLDNANPTIWKRPKHAPTLLPFFSWFTLFDLHISLDTCGFNEVKANKLLWTCALSSNPKIGDCFKFHILNRWVHYFTWTPLVEFPFSSIQFHWWQKSECCSD